jgi:hypothetical protein
VTATDESGWYQGTFQNKVGIFPGNYVRFEEDLPKTGTGSLRSAPLPPPASSKPKFSNEALSGGVSAIDNSASSISSASQSTNQEMNNRSRSGSVPLAFKQNLNDSKGQTAPISPRLSQTPVTIAKNALSQISLQRSLTSPRVPQPPPPPVPSIPASYRRTINPDPVATNPQITSPTTPNSVILKGNFGTLIDVKRPDSVANQPSGTLKGNFGKLIDVGVSRSISVNDTRASGLPSNISNISAKPTQDPQLKGNFGKLIDVQVPNKYGMLDNTQTPSSNLGMDFLNDAVSSRGSLNQLDGKRIPPPLPTRPTNITPPSIRKPSFGAGVAAQSSAAGFQYGLRRSESATNQCIWN